MNKIFLSGNLTRDFESSGNSSVYWVKNAIAVKRQFSKNDETDFFNVVAFGKTADFCQKYLGKGRRVFIEGRLQTGKFKDKDGNDRTSYDVIIDNIEFGDNKKKDDYSGDTSGNYNQDDVDVPF